MLISLLCLQNLKIADLCCVGAFFFLRFEDLWQYVFVNVKQSLAHCNENGFIFNYVHVSTKLNCKKKSNKQNVLKVVCLLIIVRL